MTIETTVPTGEKGEEKKVEGVITPPATDKEEAIPKYRFDEVNTAKKELEAKVKAFEDEKAAAIKTKLEEEGNLKALYELKLGELEKEKSELKQAAFDAKKESLITKYKIPEKLQKMVTGATIEELEASAKETAEIVKELVGEDKDKKKDIPEKKTDPTKQVLANAGTRRASLFESLKNAPELKTK